LFVCLENMKFVTFVFVIAAVCAALESCQHGDMDANCKFRDQDDWVYMVFVASWLGSFCSDGCCKLPAGVTSQYKTFTMHGMWPNYAGKDYPSCCTSPYTRENLDSAIQNDKQLRQRLNEQWPALKRCKFVRYETEKHGTCASTVYNGTKGFLDYWQAALNVLDRYDLLSALRKKGITPSNSVLYKESEIKAAIESTVGAKVNIHCATGDTKTLSEVRICLKRPTNANERKYPVPYDCPRVETSCSTKGIYLREIPEMEQGGCEF